jgi:aminopeptidase-like protein
MSSTARSSPYAEAEEAGLAMHRLMAELYPICRSITGEGFRSSLRILQREIPLEIHEVPTGTPVFDWTVPREWNIRDAFVKDASGGRVIDFRAHSLHVLNYSVPIHRTMTLAELRPHLYTLPDQPDLIPYRTSYYKEQWGFCLSHSALQRLEEGDYEVCIDSSLEPGSLTYGELFLPGETEDEVLISTHCCHPSLCNDNLSGMALATTLARQLAGLSRRYSYRFLFIPGTIGSITWLALNEERAARIRHGLVVACVGDPGGPNYKRSRRGDAEIDRAAAHVLQHSGQAYEVYDFSPYGYDERQYCSPGFNLAVGSLTRTPHGRYPEYHTSADNLDLVRPEALADSLGLYRAVIDVLEHNRAYLNTSPRGEPQLGKRGLYGSLGGNTSAKAFEMALLWVLNFSDGQHSLLDIAERAGAPFAQIRDAAAALARSGLLVEAEA